MKPKTGTCEVHKYAMNDSTFRTVYYCDICKAWICADCSDRWFMRGKAWFFRSLERLINRLNDLI